MRGKEDGILVVPDTLHLAPNQEGVDEGHDGEDEQSCDDGWHERAIIDGWEQLLYLIHIITTDEEHDDESDEQ